MRINKKIMLLSLFISILLTACAAQQNLQNIDTANLAQLESIRIRPKGPFTSRTELSNIRIKALQDTAMSLGAQGGLAWASEELNAKLTQDRVYLETIFNFNALYLKHGVLPPVLEEGDNSLNLADPNTIRIADKTYKIIQQARFATTAPNWREYIWLTFAKPSMPDKTLLPKTAEEQRIWKKAIQLGWQKGIEQSYSIFQQSLARLRRDFRGMLLYRKLLDEKMISAPFVARTELGVTGSGEDMRINDQVLRIVEHPKLQTNTKDWQAIVVPKDP